MAKLTLNNILGGYQTVDAYNDNNALTEAAIENTLSRDGTTPNQMGSDIDLNSNDLLNADSISAADITANSLILNGVLVTPVSGVVIAPDATQISYTPTNPAGPLTTLQDALDDDYLRNDRAASITFPGNFGFTLAYDVSNLMTISMSPTGSPQFANVGTGNPPFYFGGDILPLDISAWDLGEASPRRWQNIYAERLDLSERLDIDSSTEPAINLVTQGSIKFPAIATPSADPNTLDHYEKGTFTPTIQDDTFSDAESQTTDIQTGEYTRIGNLVTFILHIRVTSLGSLTGANAAHIGNLPFTVGSLTGGASCAFSNGISIPSESSITGTCVPGTTRINLNKWSGTAGTLAMLVSEVSATGQIQLFGHYYV